MVYGIGTANLPGFVEFANPGLTRRHEQGRYPIIQARNDTSTAPLNNTVNLFMDVESDDYGFVASVITACLETTVYAIRCTKAPKNEVEILAGLGFNPGDICGPTASVCSSF